MEKIIKKWSPVLETLKVSEKNYEFFSTYAEKLLLLLSVEDNEQNLLPVNMKILSKLDFDNINITLTENENVDVYEIKEMFDTEELISIVNSEDNDNIIPVMEGILIDKFITLLNTKKEISIYKLVNSIDLRKDGSNVEMFITSRIKFNQ